MQRRMPGKYLGRWTGRTDGWNERRKECWNKIAKLDIKLVNVVLYGNTIVIWGIICLPSRNPLHLY